MSTTGNVAIGDSADRIEAKIVQACTSSGLFRAVGSVASVALPVAALPIGVINAGVDQVCANPARYANDLSTVSWVIWNLWDNRS